MGDTYGQGGCLALEGNVTREAPEGAHRCLHRGGGKHGGALSPLRCESKDGWVGPSLRTARVVRSTARGRCQSGSRTPSSKLGVSDLAGGRRSFAPRSSGRTRTRSCRLQGRLRGRRGALLFADHHGRVQPILSACIALPNTRTHDRRASKSEDMPDTGPFKGTSEVRARAALERRRGEVRARVGATLGRGRAQLRVVSRVRR